MRRRRRKKRSNTTACETYVQCTAMLERGAFHSSVTDPCFSSSDTLSCSCNSQESFVLNPVVSESVRSISGNSHLTQGVSEQSSSIHVQDHLCAAVKVRCHQSEMMEFEGKSEEFAEWLL